MRVLLATKMMDVGGIERSVVWMAREFQQRGHAVWVVSSGGYLVADLERAGVHHVAAPLTLTSPFGILKSARIIRRLVVQEKIDLVHSFSATAAVAVNLAMRAWRPRQYTHVHRVSSPMGLQNSPREWPPVTWLRNWILTLGQERILVISPEIRRHLERVRAPGEALVDFNFVGLDVATFRAHENDRSDVRAEFGFGDDSLIVTTIGALHQRKSHELFVDAAAEVAAEEPRARFLIVGGGDLQPRLEQMAANRGLQGRIVFTGVRDDVPRLLSATDVYVKPGILEGFIGITVLEALALSKPVVAFDTEDVKLALHDGQTGLVVPNADTHALAEKLLFLLRHPDVGRQLGEAGRALVEERFQFGVLAQRLEELYAQLVLERPLGVLDDHGVEPEPLVSGNPPRR